MLAFLGSLVIIVQISEFLLDQLSRTALEVGSVRTKAALEALDAALQCDN